MKGYSRYFWFIHFIGDVLFINVSFLLTYYIKFSTFDFSDKYRFLFLFNSVWILVALMLDIYKLKQLKRFDKIVYNLLKAFVFNAVIIGGILFSLKASGFLESNYIQHIYLFFYLLFLEIYSSKINTLL